MCSRCLTSPTLYKRQLALFEHKNVVVRDLFSFRRTDPKLIAALYLWKIIEEKIPLHFTLLFPKKLYEVGKEMQRILNKSGFHSDPNYLCVLAETLTHEELFDDRFYDSSVIKVAFSIENEE